MLNRLLRSHENYVYENYDPTAAGVIQFYANLSEAEAMDWNRRLMIDFEAARGTIGSNASGKRILMLVVSNLAIDPRVQRQAEELVRRGWQVSVLCPDYTQGDIESIRIAWDPRIQIFVCGWTAANFISERPSIWAGELYKRALDVIGDEIPFAIHCHDLFTCAAGLALAHETGSHLVADFHEWTSENVHWDVPAKGYQPYPPEWKAELQALEARVLREASAVITVCDSIAEALAEELGNGRKVDVIRNIPALSATPTREYPPLKAQLGLREDQFLLLWQGGTGPTRLIEPIIEALAFAPGCIFAIRGPSLDLFGEGYRAIAEKAGAANRLILLDPVASRDVVAAARGADAGIWTLPRLCRNFTYALPNKIFEYTASNLALLVADYPEARRMVETHQIGLTFDPYDPRSIAAAINRLIDEPRLAKRFRANTHTALKSLDAESEWQKLVALYDALPRSEPGGES